jgi:hypothetical protein
MLTAHKQSRYLCLFYHQSVGTSKQAQRMAREAGVTVLSLRHHAGMEVMASAREAERLRDSGLFSAVFADAMKREHVKDLPETQQRLVAVWNARFGKRFKKARQAARQHIGKSWADPKMPTPTPVSDLDHRRLRTLLLSHAKRLRLTMPRGGLGKPLYRTTTADAFKKFELRLLGKLKDRKSAHELAIAAAKLAPWAARVLDRLDITDLLDLLNRLEEADEEDGCWKMHGNISVAIVFVDSSKSSSLKFSDDEKSDIEAEIIDGLDWLAIEHPSNDLSWNTRTFDVRLDVSNGGEDADDDYFTLPALDEIEFDGNTYGASWTDFAKFREDMRDADSADHAFVIFVTTLNVDGVLFAMPSIKYIVLSKQDDWKGWGQGNINHITVHETSHLFGAKDEYTSTSGTPCSNCDLTSGCDNIPNGNCKECAVTGVDCAMDANELTLCGYTRGQIGWSHLFVELYTADEHLAGTDDDVEIDIGHRTYNLDTPDHDDRERKNREGYAVWDPDLAENDIRRVLIRKSPDGSYGGWKLKRVVVHFGDHVICDETINVWLEDESSLFKVVKTFADRDPDLVNSLDLTVTTADVSHAGTDDDVTFQTAGRSWDVDSTDDDFERGSTRTYSLDPSTALHVSDITTVIIKKSADGFYGGWKLGGLRLTANGTVIYNNSSINTWLEDDSRTFVDNV